MEKRAKRMRRLLDVLQQLQEIEEQRKTALERRYEELQRSQREVFHALETNDALHGLFVDNNARFLKNLAVEAQRVAEARDEQSQRVLEQTIRMKTAERLKSVLDQFATRGRKTRELYDVIERYVNQRGA